MEDTRKLPKEKAQAFSASVNDAAADLGKVKDIIQRLQLARPWTPSISQRQEKELAERIDKAIEHLKEARRSIDAKEE